MNLSADILLDRMKLKNKLNLWMLMSLISFLALCLLSVKDLLPKEKAKNNDYIARIKIEGLITEDSKRNKVLDDISKNNNIKAVIIHINSPGGTFVGSEDIYNNIRNISQKKPVIALMGSAAASGGYMSAIAADYILAHHGTITGSIGVILQSFEISELAKKIGVNLLTYKSGKYKAVPSLFEPPTDDINKQVYNTIMDHYDVFVDMVSERRKINKDELMSLADGRIYTGRQAVANKLIDSLGNESDAIKWLQEEKHIDTLLNTKDISLTDEDNIIKKLFPKINIFENAKFSTESLHGTLALWNP